MAFASAMRHLAPLPNTQKHRFRFNPQKVSDKKFGFFQAQSAFFSEVANELGLQALQTPFTAIHLPFWSKQQMISVTPLSILKMASTWAGFQSPTLWSTLSNW